MITDGIIERNIINEANRPVGADPSVDPLIAIAAEIFLRPYKPNRRLDMCSNGADRFSAYVAPRVHIVRDRGRMSA